jgi:hypothetical protein
MATRRRPSSPSLSILLPSDRLCPARSRRLAERLGVCIWQISLQMSAIAGELPDTVDSVETVPESIHPEGRGAFSSRCQRNGQRWWPCDEFGETPQVLGNSRESKLVLCAARASSRRRPSRRVRFRCANRISMRLRSRCDCSNASVPTSDRATSRACSWMLRGIFRAGSFGQHRDLSEHRSQSSLLAR